MTLKTQLHLVEIGAAPRELAPEFTRLFLAGLPSGQVVTVTAEGAAFNPAWANMRFCFYGRRVGDVNELADGAPWLTIDDGPGAMIAEIWLQRVYVAGCETFGEVLWTPAGGQEFSFRNVTRRRSTDEYAKIDAAMRALAQVTKRGRPAGSGDWTPERFRAELQRAIAQVQGAGEVLTQEAVTTSMFLDVRHFQRLLKHYGYSWQDVRSGNF